jgi:hypothetical protein
MLNFERIFGRRSRFVFWGIVPIGAILLTLMTLNFTGWTVKRAIIVGVLDLTFLLFALGIYDPARFSWSLRTCMAIVFLGYCAWVADEFFSGKSRLFDAFHALIAIGIPALLFAIRGFSVKLKVLSRPDPYAPPPPIHPK